MLWESVDYRLSDDAREANTLDSFDSFTVNRQHIVAISKFVEWLEDA